MNRNRLLASRMLLALVILLSGLALLPFGALSAEEIDWQLFSGSYSPHLDVLSEDDKGAPGSAFLFEASRFPPNQIATIEIDGRTRGAVTIDANGRAQFVIETAANDPLGEFNVGVYTDENHVAYDDLRLRDDKPLQPAPVNWSGPTFTLFGPAATMNVNYDSGAPGSAFVFSANGFPANSPATVLIDGEQRDTVMTDGNGRALFAVQSSDSRNAHDAYYVALRSGDQTTALSACAIDATQPLRSLPQNYSGPIVPLTSVPTSVSVSSLQTALSLMPLLLVLVAVLLSGVTVMWKLRRPQQQR